MTAGTHYDYVVDADSDTTAGRLVRLVGRGKHVLDLGCAAGALDRVLVQRGCTVTGVEIDPDAARLAEAVCERVVVGDLDTLDLGATFERGAYDVVLAGDVLEHLKDPARVLRHLHPLLRPGGHLVLSVPNAGHADVRLALLHGDLPRSATGLLDSTHLQFLTRAGLLALLRDGAFTPLHLEEVRLGVGDSEVPYPEDALTAAVSAGLWEDPEALVYQYVALAVPGASAELDVIPSLLNRHAGRGGVPMPAAPRPAPTKAVERGGVEELREWLALERLNHTDTAWRASHETRRLQELVWGGERALVAERRRRKAARRKLRQAAAAELTAAQAACDDRLAAVTAERDEGLRALARGEGSPWRPLADALRGAARRARAATARR